MSHTVAIVDDHTLLSQALSELVSQFDDFKVIYTCANGKELLNQFEVSNVRPEIVLMDINMPVLNGIETTKIVYEKYPEISVIALSVEDDEQTILKMLRAGAKGYLVKDTKKGILEEALHETIQYGFYHTNTVTNLLVENLSHNISEQEYDFTERELEFIQLACTDLTYKEIADVMILSPKTIDKYREAVFQKCNAKNRIGLVLFAIRNGIFNVIENS